MAAEGVAARVREGIEVLVDLAWARSWPGIRQAARMQSSELTETERFLAMVEYYERACPNIDDVDEALRARADGEVTANDVLAFVGAALREGEPKN